MPPYIQKSGDLDPPFLNGNRTRIINHLVGLT